MPYINRWLKESFLLYTKATRVVLVSGARQCGKTTLLSNCCSKKDIFFSLDDASTLSQATYDPEAFLRAALSSAPRVFIDEVQKAPALFGQIKFHVDRDTRLGRIILSGSSNFRSNPFVQESLAGRVSELRLRALTAAEIAGIKKPHFFDSLLKKDFGRPFYSVDECSKAVVLQKALLGGYPAVFTMAPQLRRVWFQGYVNALVERDLLETHNFQKKEDVKKILTELSSRSSRNVNVSDLSRTLQMDGRRVRNFMEALRTMYIVDAVPAWTRKPLDRLAKQPKWFISDTGLMSAVLGHFSLEDLNRWTEKKGEVASDFVGNLIETWVYNQLATLTDIDEDWRIYHWRLSERQEIDFILENTYGDLILIEVKASETVSSDDFKNMQWFKERNPDQVKSSLLFYCGQNVRDFGCDQIALPMAFFWS